MDTLSQDELKRRGFISTMSLFFQSGYSAVLGLIANLIVTILLSPHVFGIYITVLSIIALLNYFSDVGLAASLIQKKEMLDDDVKTTFTIQQSLIVVLITIGFFATPYVRRFYDLPIEGIYLYWSLLFSFFISSLKTIPSIFLERHIKFNKVVYVQVVENTLFYSAVSILALMDYGLMSFTYAIMLRAVVGLILIYRISPWRPQLGLNKQSMKTLMSFGIPFQATSFLALFKDDLIILFLGKILGFELLGYVGWAKKWADAPLRVFMDNVGRVLFPVMARVQDNKEKLRNISKKLLYYQTMLLAPVLIGMIFALPLLVALIPQYSKWLPAIPLFYIFAISSLIVSFSAPFMALFNALGKVKITFSFMLLITIVTWLLTPLFTTKFGIYGFPYTHLIVSSTLGLLLLKVRTELNMKILPSIYKPLLASAGMALILFFLKQLFPEPTIALLVIVASTGAVSYFTIMTYVFKTNIFKELLQLKKDHA